MGFGDFVDPRYFRTPTFLPDEEDDDFAAYSSIMQVFPTRRGLEILSQGMSDTNDMPPGYPLVNESTPPGGTAPPVLPRVEQKKPSKWRNIAGNAAGILQDAMVGAGTPNIAGGGATDVFRAMANASGAAQNRQLRNEQREIAQEQRRQRAEAHQQEMRTRQAVAEKTIETQQTHQDLYRKQAEALAKKPGVHVSAQGIYDLETKKLTPWPPAEKPNEMQQRLALLEERFKATGDKGWDPNTPENQTYIKYGDKDPTAKPKGSRSEAEIYATGTDEERSRLDKRSAAKAQHAEKLAQIRKKQSTGELTPAQALRLTQMYVGFNNEKEKDQAAADVWAQGESDRQMRLYPGGVVPKEVTANIEAQRKERHRRAQEAYDINVRTADMALDRSPARGTSVPAAAAPSPSPAGPRRMTGIDKRTGQPVTLEWINGQWQPVK